MDRIYHGCFRKNVDGTNRIIGSNKRCLIPSSKLFWMYIEDIHGGVKTAVSIIDNVLLMSESMTPIFEIKTKRTLNDGKNP